MFMGRPFLGQVPLRGFSLGQRRRANQYIPESGGIAPEHPFRPGETQEEYDRWETYTPLISQKQLECQALLQNLMDAQTAYENAPEDNRDAELDTWANTEDSYYACLDAVDKLVSYRDYGGTPPVEQWPSEVPEPTIGPVMQGIPARPLYQGRF